MRKTRIRALKGYFSKFRVLYAHPDTSWRGYKKAWVHRHLFQFTKLVGRGGKRASWVPSAVRLRW